MTRRFTRRGAITGIGTLAIGPCLGEEITTGAAFNSFVGGNSRDAFPVFANAAAGIQWTKDGQYFLVLGNSRYNSAVLYLNESGRPIEQARYSDRQAYERLCPSGQREERNSLRQNSTCGHFATVRSMTDLIAHTSFSHAVTEGYFASGDGGGANYRLVDAEPAHPGKIRDHRGRWWEITETEFRFEQFGATGDNGTEDTDDTFALVNCLEAAAALSVPIEASARTFILSKDISIAVGEGALNLNGAGISQTRILLKDSATLSILGNKKGGSRIGLSNMSILDVVGRSASRENQHILTVQYGESTSLVNLGISVTTRPALFLSQLSKFLVEKCCIKGPNERQKTSFPSGIHVESCTEGRIFSSNLESLNGTAIELESAGAGDLLDWTLECTGNIIKKCGIGFKLGGSNQKTYIQGNTIIECSDGGVSICGDLVDGGECSVSITNNVIRKCGNAESGGIRLLRPGSAVEEKGCSVYILGNSIIGSSYGIVINYKSSTKSNSGIYIQGNVIQDAIYSGVCLMDSSGNIDLSFNTVFHCGKEGIICAITDDAAAYVTLRANCVSNFSRSQPSFFNGIRVQGNDRSCFNVLGNTALNANVVGVKRAPGILINSPPNSLANFVDNSTDPATTSGVLILHETRR